MRGLAVLAASILGAAGCSQAAPPSPVPAAARDLLARLQEQTMEQGHGLRHRANNALQREFWKRLQELPPGPETDALLLDAAENVYTRYDMNYYNGMLWHWPYLSSRRAIELCDRILKSTLQPDLKERTLWIKAFALRCPPVDPWEDAEKDLETYAEQRRWMPDYEASRKIYQALAAESPGSPRGVAAARLAAQPDLSIMLPTGPKEPDPRDPR